MDSPITDQKIKWESVNKTDFKFETENHYFSKYYRTIDHERYICLSWECKFLETDTPMILALHIRTTDHHLQKIDNFVKAVIFGVTPSKITNGVIPQEIIDKATPIKPTHYKGKSGQDLLGVMKDFDLDKCFYIGNALKYLFRAGKKEGNSEKQDILKAIEYLQRKIEE